MLNMWCVGNEKKKVKNDPRDSGRHNYINKFSH